jgi:hypothetical protein
MKVGTGYSNNPDAMMFGKVVAEKILSSGGPERPNLMMAFCSGNLIHEEYYDGLRSIFGHSIPIIGGPAIGIITNNIISYTGHPAGAVALQSDSLQCQVGSANRLDADEKDAVQRLVKQLKPGSDDSLLLFFYDSIRKPAQAVAPPEFNTSSTLINGIEEALTYRIPVIGAGLVGGFSLINTTSQFCGSSVGQQSVVGAVCVLNDIRAEDR